MTFTTTRRSFLKRTGAGLGLAAVGSTSFQTQPQKPNIVLFLADDLGYADLSCYGRTDLKTPAIDLLAREGVRFTSFYANAPECSPTRTALLTGRYQHRVGGLECAIGVGNVGRYDDAIRLQNSRDLGLPTEETSIARLLKRAGYATAICGKWHLGYETKFSPTRHGFDHAFYAAGGAIDYFHHVEPPPSRLHALYLNGEPINREGYFTDLITEEAIRFVDARSSSEPFFLYVPYTAPHAPYQGPAEPHPEPLPPDSERWKQGTAPPAVYAAMIERMDHGVGTILRKLDEKGLAENTLILFMSDNGGTRSGRNTPFSGFKSSLYEGGIRVPCVVRWPSLLQAGTIRDEPCMTMDFSASIVRAAGTSPDAGRPFDGEDVLRLVQERKPAGTRALFWRARRAETTLKAVREGSLKYIFEQRGNQVQEHLFDLKDDPAEKADLLKNHPDQADRLRHLIRDWEQKVKPRR